MTLRDISIRGAGIISVILILLPGVAALFFSEQALEQIRLAENREPIPLDGLIAEPRDLGDPATWDRVAAALSDRIPLRVRLTRLLRGVEREFLYRRYFDTVVISPGPWMYYRPSLDATPLSTGAIDDTLKTLNLWTTEHSGTLFIAPAPDKVSIYPEHLRTHRFAYEAQKAERDALHAWFASSDAPGIIDTWSPIQQAKADSREPLYFRTDTHYTAHGAVIYARTLVNAIVPSVWDDAAVVIGEPRRQRRDLTNLAGLPGPTEPSAPLSVQRSGVEAVTCLVEAGPVDCGVAFLVQDRPVRIQARAEPGVRTISGRTLLVHDSFVESFLKPFLWSYFDDISFVHVKYLEAGDLAAALSFYDRVIISRVERNLPQILGWLQIPANPTNVGWRLGLQARP